MRRTILLGTTLALAACGLSRTDTMRNLAEAQAVAAQKDSLLKEVAQTSTFIAELSRQVGTVRNLKTGRPAKGGPSDLEENLTPSERRDQILAQVREITARLNESESRLATSRRRVAELTGSDAAKNKRLAAFDSAVAAFRNIIETQKTQLADMSVQIVALTEENGQLKSDNALLTSTASLVTAQRDSVIAEQNTVYYVADTRASLARRHLIESSGGFLGIGRASVPAHALDPTAFTPIDLRQVHEIELPRAGHRYRIITSQDLAALDTKHDSKGRLAGTLKIRDPQRFWAGSKFLIMVEQ